MTADVVLIAHSGEKLVSYVNLSNFDFGSIVSQLSYIYNVAFATNIDEDGNFQATLTVMVPTYDSDEMNEVLVNVNAAFKEAFIGFR